MPKCKRTDRFVRARKQRLLIDGGECVVCGSGKNPTVHHIVKTADGGSDALSNLVTLCFQCHANWHAFEHRREGGDFMDWAQRQGAEWIRVG